MLLNIWGIRNGKHYTTALVLFAMNLRNVPHIGNPAPCQARPGATTLRVEIYSKVLSHHGSEPSLWGEVNKESNLFYSRHLADWSA